MYELGLSLDNESWSIQSKYLVNFSYTQVIKNILINYTHKLQFNLVNF